MGFNISGVVINKSLENNNEELSKILGLNIDFKREIDFETASENWKEEGIVDVYFGEKGTLVFANHDLCLEGYSYPQANILTFALSETSMTFSFGYSENDNIIRSKMDVNGEIIDENGEKLQVENENDDISEVIWKQIETVLGKSFWSIEPEEKAYRFLIKNDSSNNQPVNNEQDELTENEKRLKNTEAYKTINEIADEYLKEIESRGKFDLKEVLNGIVNLGEDSRSQELAIKNAQDLIDIYFWKKQLSNPNFKDCVISDSIQVFSFYFKVFRKKPFLLKTRLLCGLSKIAR